MPRYKLTIEYDGTPFAGWQRQADQPTVQAALEDLFQTLEGHVPLVEGAGRTDAGVHARGQVAHVDLLRVWDSFVLMQAINALLRPLPISIVQCQAVPDTFHARFQAQERLYHYHVINRRAPLVLEKGRAWIRYKPLDLASMQRAAAYLCGTHDFTSFRARECQSPSPVKCLDQCDIHHEADRFIFRVRGKSFLHHQVRNMVGSLVQVGEGKRSVEEIPAILAARDRRVAGPTAPPEGLYFMKVRYEDGDKH
jgi:tRNA pseudouridine38-40 synthase